MSRNIKAKDTSFPMEKDDKMAESNLEVVLKAVKDFFLKNKKAVTVHNIINNSGEVAGFVESNGAVLFIQMQLSPLIWERKK